MVMKDAREVPELKNHPAVTHRPYLIFYAGVILVSRLGRQPHPLGFVFPWGSAAVTEFGEEQIERLKELSREALAELQRSLLNGLGLTEKEVKEGTLELPAVWVRKNTPEWEVVGINEQWTQLTGVGLDIFKEYPGLFSILEPADGSPPENLIKMIFDDAKRLPKGASIPVLLSPRASSGSSLQYVVAVKQARNLPPSLLLEASSGANTPAIDDLWFVEIHARIQADIPEGSSLSAISPSYQSVKSSAGSSSQTIGDLSSKNSDRWVVKRGERASNLPPRFKALKFGDVLGSGGFADVYAGSFGDRPVAIKVISVPPRESNEVNNWTVKYEAHLAVDMVHENVTKTFDWCRVTGTIEDQVWIIQELCDCGSLSNALEEGLLRVGGDPEGPPDMRTVLETALDVAHGLRYLHGRQEVHSDLSTNNLLLTSANNRRGFICKVTDFGLSRLGSKKFATRTIGTVSHMAPEVLMEGIVTTAADVYAFGVLLWEMWSGKRAWRGMSPAQVILAVTCRNQKFGFPENTLSDYAQLATECMLDDSEKRPGFNEIVPRLEAMVAALTE